MLIAARAGERPDDEDDDASTLRQTDRQPGVSAVHAPGARNDRGADTD